MMRKLMLMIGASVFLTQCGDASQSCSKDFRFYLLTKDAAFQAFTEDQIKLFNQEIGKDVLKLVHKPELATSTISFVENLREEDASGDGFADNKIGWGQWIRRPERNWNLSQAFLGTTQDKHSYFSMKLRLDAGFIRDRYESGDPKKEFENLKLFRHELGHGLTLPHSANLNDVMYPDISYATNVQSVTKWAKTFLKDQACISAWDA